MKKYEEHKIGQKIHKAQRERKKMLEVKKAHLEALAIQQARFEEEKERQREFQRKTSNMTPAQSEEEIEAERRAVLEEKERKYQELLKLEQEIKKAQEDIDYFPPDDSDDEEEEEEKGKKRTEEKEKEKKRTEEKEKKRTAEVTKTKEKEDAQPVGDYYEDNEALELDTPSFYEEKEKGKIRLEEKVKAKARKKPR